MLIRSRPCVNLYCRAITKQSGMATPANYCLKPTHARGSIHVMSNLIPTDIFAARRLPKLIMCLALLLSCYGAVTAAAWHNIEPLKSRRADVERELGKPVSGA